MSDAQGLLDHKEEVYPSIFRNDKEKLIYSQGHQSLFSPNNTIFDHLENTHRNFQEKKPYPEIETNLEFLLSEAQLKSPENILLTSEQSQYTETCLVKELQQNKIDGTSLTKKREITNLRQKLSKFEAIQPQSEKFPNFQDENQTEEMLKINKNNQLLKLKPESEFTENIQMKKSQTSLGGSDTIVSQRKSSNQQSNMSSQVQGILNKEDNKNSPNQSSPSRFKSKKVQPLSTSSPNQQLKKQSLIRSKNVLNFLKKGTTAFGDLEINIQSLSPRLKQFQISASTPQNKKNNSPLASPIGFHAGQHDQQSGIESIMQKWAIALRVKMINRFYQKVKNQTSQINYKFLKKLHFDLIDDKAFFFDSSQLNSASENKGRSALKFNFLKNLYSSICSLPVISANSRFMTFWRIIYSLLILWQICLIPFQISFDLIFDHDQASILLYLVPLVMYIFNIFVQLNSGYYEMGTEQLNRMKVFYNYRYQLAIDLIIISAFIMTNFFHNPYLNIVFYLKLTQLYSDVTDIVEHFKIHQEFSLFYTLSRLMFLILFLAHSCGCIFQLISQKEYENGNEQVWLVVSQIQDDSIYVKYINSLYFSVITMVTVGYGDVRPIAQSEKIFVILMALLGSVVFGYVVNTIGAIFQELAQKEDAFKKKKYDLSNFMANRQIKQETQLKVMKYLDYIKRQEDDNPLIGENYLGLVSKNLQEEIQRDFYGRMLLQHKLFSSNFSIQFLNAMSLHFKERVLGPGEMFFEKGSLSDPDIYFIQKGRVQIYYECGNQSKHLAYYQQGQLFGYHSFFNCGVPRSFSAKSKTNTHVLVLPNSKFLQVLKNFPSDFEKYHKIKDDVKLYNQNDHIACLSCGKYNHNMENCHFIHYKRNREFIIARYSYSVPSIRNKQFVRRDKINFSSLKDNSKSKEQLKRLRLDIQETILKQKLEDEEREDDSLQVAIPDIHRNSLMKTTDRKFFFSLPKIKYQNSQLIYKNEDDELENSLGRLSDDSSLKTSSSSQESEENEEEEQADEIQMETNILEREEEDEEDSKHEKNQNIRLSADVNANEEKNSISKSEEQEKKQEQNSPIKLPSFQIDLQLHKSHLLSRRRDSFQIKPREDEQQEVQLGKSQLSPSQSSSSSSDYFSDQSKSKKKEVNSDQKQRKQSKRKRQQEQQEKGEDGKKLEFDINHQIQTMKSKFHISNSTESKQQQGEKAAISPKDSESQQQVISTTHSNPSSQNKKNKKKKHKTKDIDMWNEVQFHQPIQELPQTDEIDQFSFQNQDNFLFFSEKSSSQSDPPKQFSQYGKNENQSQISFSNKKLGVFPTATFISEKEPNSVLSYSPSIKSRFAFSLANPSINNSIQLSHSKQDYPASDNSVYQDHKKKKSFLTRDQSFKSKKSRDSKILRGSILEESLFSKNRSSLIQNPHNYNNINLTNTMSDWNATPIQKAGIRDSNSDIGSITLENNTQFKTFTKRKDKKERQSSLIQMQKSNNSDEDNLLSRQLIQSSTNTPVKKSKFALLEQIQRRRSSAGGQHSLIVKNQGHHIESKKSFDDDDEPSSTPLFILKNRKESEKQKKNTSSTSFSQKSSPLNALEQLMKNRQRKSFIALQSSQLSGIPSSNTRQSINGNGRRNSIYQNSQPAFLNNNSNSKGNSNNVHQAKNIDGQNLNEDLVNTLKEILLHRKYEQKEVPEHMFSHRSSHMYRTSLEYEGNLMAIEYKNMLFMPDFDQMKEYQYYYEHNNVSSILRKFKGKQKIRRFLGSRLQQKRKLQTIIKAQAAFNGLRLISALNSQQSSN